MTNQSDKPLACHVDECHNEVTCIVHDSQELPFVTCGRHNDHGCGCGQCVGVDDANALAHALVQALSDNDNEIAELDAEIEAKRRELFEAKLRIKQLEESLVVAQSESRQTIIETVAVAELADARRVLAQWRAERAPQPDEIEFQRIDARRRDALSREDRLSGTCAKIHVAHGNQKLTAQQSRLLGLFLLAASNDSPVPDDVCDACMGQGSHIGTGTPCPHCNATGTPMRAQRRP